MTTVLWEGPLDFSGYGQVCVNCILTLKKLGCNVGVAKQGAYVDTRVPLTKVKSKVRVICSNPLALRKVNKEQYVIGYTYYECQPLPDRFASHLKSVDEIWAPSRFSEQLYREAGVVNVHYIPQGVNTDLYHPNVKPLKILNAEGFKFLYVSEFNYRKGVDLLLRAYIEEFTSKDKATLILRIFPVPRLLSLIKKLSKGRSGLPKIVYVEEHVPAEKMPNLYKTCNCYVMPGRGGEVNNTVSEAAAVGTGIIASRCGGYLEFLNPSNSLQLRILGLEPVRELSPNWYPKGVKWFKPDLEHLKALMRYAYEHQEEVKEMGKRVAMDIKKLSYDNTCKMIIERLDEVGSNI